MRSSPSDCRTSDVSNSPSRSPNARSSHKVPTPQGGGIAVIATTVLIVALVALLRPTARNWIGELPWILAATVLLAAVGTIDDFHTLQVTPRLVCRLVAVVIVIASAAQRLKSAILPALVG